MEPTAVVVPLDQMLGNDEYWELATTELFGPFQVRMHYPAHGVCGRMLSSTNAAVVRTQTLPPRASQ